MHARGRNHSRIPTSEFTRAPGGAENSLQPTMRSKSIQSTTAWAEREGITCSSRPKHAAVSNLARSAAWRNQVPKARKALKMPMMRYSLGLHLPSKAMQRTIQYAALCFAFDATIRWADWSGRTIHASSLHSWGRDNGSEIHIGSPIAHSSTSERNY